MGIEDTVIVLRQCSLAGAGFSVHDDTSLLVVLLLEHDLGNCVAGIVELRTDMSQLRNDVSLLLNSLDIIE